MVPPPPPCSPLPPPLCWTKPVWRRPLPSSASPRAAYSRLLRVWERLGLLGPEAAEVLGQAGVVGHDVLRLVQAEHLLVHLLAHAVHAVAVHKGRVDDHGELAFEVEPDGQGAAAHLRTALRVEGRHEGVVQRQHVLQLVVAQSEPESTSQPLATRHRIICTTLFHLAPFIPVALWPGKKGRVGGGREVLTLKILTFCIVVLN